MSLSSSGCQIFVDCFLDTILFVSIQCDPDGWVLKVNKEQNYPHSFHLFHASEIKSVNVLGDVQLSYIGFGSKGGLPPFVDNQAGFLSLALTQILSRRHQFHLTSPSCALRGR